MSKGSQERADTEWLYLAVPTSPRRKRKLRKAGVKEQDIPEKSVMVILAGDCKRFQRKHHARMGEQGIRNCRARFQKVEHKPDGVMYRPYTRQDIQQ